MKKAIKKNMFLSFMLIVSAAVILWPHIKKFLLTDFVLPKLNTYVNENIPSGFNLKIEKMSFNIFSGFSFEDLRLLSDNVEVLRASTADIDLSLSDALNKRCGLLIKDIVFKVENNVLLTKGNCEVFVEKGKIEIRSVTGHILGQRFHYSGKIAYSGEKEVLLNGTWAQIKNNFKLSIVSGNRAMLDWDGKSGGTWFRVHGVSNDFDSMLFDINAEGKVKIEDFLKKYSLTGMVSFLGNLKGVVGKISSLSGNVSLQIRDCSRGNFTIPSMECNVRVAKGLAEIHVPHSQVYGGTITGMCVVDLNNLYSFNGIDAVIKNVDLEKLSVVSGYLKGISGILSGRIACVRKGDKISTIKGGGYIDLKNADIWNAPVFSQTGSGVKSVSTSIGTQKLESAKGNYEISDGKIFTDNLTCSAKNMNFWLKGALSFKGDADFTAGIKLSAKGMSTNKNMILGFMAPEALMASVGFNMVSNTICVNISGRIPDLSYKTDIQPLGWLTGFMPDFSSGGVDENKFTLRKLMAEASA